MIHHLVHIHRALRAVGLSQDLQRNRQGHGQSDGQDPNQQDQFDGSGQLGHGVGQEGVAYGQVPFGRECCDGEHGGVAGGLREETPEEAEFAPEDVGVFVPDDVDLLGQTREEQHQVGDGQTEQVIIRSCVHHFVLSYHYAGADIPYRPQQEYRHVYNSNRYHYVQGVPLKFAAHRPGVVAEIFHFGDLPMAPTR